MRAAFEALGNMGRAGIPVQKGVAALFNRLAKREARELLGMDAEKPRKLRKKALPAPAKPSSDEIV
jgi:hypothetical protein